MENNCKIKIKNKFITPTTFLVGLTFLAVPLSIISCKTSSDYATVVFNHLDGSCSEQRIQINKSFKEAGLSLPKFTYKHQTWYDELGNVFTVDSKVTGSVALKEDCAVKVNIDPTIGDVKVGGDNVTFTATLTGDPSQYDINDFEWKVIDEVIHQEPHKTIELSNPKILDSNRASVEIKAIDIYNCEPANLYFAPKDIYSGFKINLKEVSAYKSKEVIFDETEHEYTGEFKFKCESTYDLTTKDPSFNIEINPLNDNENIAVIELYIDSESEPAFISKVVLPKQNKHIIVNVKIPKEKFRNDSSKCKFTLRSMKNIRLKIDESSLPVQIFALNPIAKQVSTLQPLFMQDGVNLADFSLEGYFVYKDITKGTEIVSEDHMKINPFNSFPIQEDLTKILTEASEKDPTVIISFKSDENKNIAGLDYTECTQGGLFEIFNERTAVKHDGEHDKFQFQAQAKSEEKAGNYTFSVKDGDKTICSTESIEVTTHDYAKINIEIKDDDWKIVSGSVLKIVPTKV